MEGGVKEGKGDLWFGDSFSRIVLGGISAAVTGAVCYWAPYIVGKSYFARRNSMLNIPSGLFENTAEDYFAYSYYAMLTVITNLSEFFLGDFRRTAYIAAFSCVFVVYIIFLVWLSKSNVKFEFVRKVEAKRVFSVPLAVLLMSAGLTVFISLAPAFVFTILVVPGFLGAQAAVISVEEDRLIYANGCLIANARKWQCSRLIRDGSTIAEGFLIASSKEWVAMYSKGVTKVLPVSGSSIESGGYAWAK